MSSNPTLDRRAFVRGAGLLCAGMWAAPALAITEAEMFPGGDDALRQDQRHHLVRCARIQRRAVRRVDCREESLEGAATARQLERRARMLRLRRDLAAGDHRSPLRIFLADHVGPACRRHGRGHAHAQRLVARREGRRRQAAGVRIVPRRRLHDRLGQRAGLRRRSAGALRRRRRRDGQSSARRARLPGSRRCRRFRGIRRRRLRRVCSISWPR